MYHILIEDAGTQWEGVKIALKSYKQTNKNIWVWYLIARHIWVKLALP